MTDGIYMNVVQDAITQPDEDLFVSEYGYPDWFDEISPDGDEAVKILRGIHRAVHMSIRDLINAIGMTQVAFARHFVIPLRTVENWAGGQRECPLYLKLLMAQDLGIFKR